MRTVTGTRLVAICPYFTMFPPSFPSCVIWKEPTPSAVLDPFCGRGTTNFVARCLGVRTAGIDVSPVAVAATEARLVHVAPETLIAVAKEIVSSARFRDDPPTGEFWEWAYHPRVLDRLCALRRALASEEYPSPVRAALRGIILGALHGPLQKTKRSYFSNQCPRTYAPKPAYSVRFWKEKGLRPPEVDVLRIIAERAYRFYGQPIPTVSGVALLGDSREPAIIDRASDLAGPFDCIVTSPPYYGLRTYVPDQWLRNWFLGGPPQPDYSYGSQISHRSLGRFIADLSTVWRNVARHCVPGARLALRFGTIGDRPLDDPAGVIAETLKDTGWRIEAVRSADDARRGKRQADTFQRRRSSPRKEIDLEARWCP
ncbi:MAG: hypothetical protein RMK73_10900 [Geminicoccaceae bacterium]|nr:hypothetical protein [Geminicoccaceae bacterium]